MGADIDITLKQLQIFHAVVVAGSITKAARRIALSQPSISQQLAKLEQRLETQLFQRNRSGTVDLTPAGEYWYKFGDDLLRRVDGAAMEHRRRFIESSVTLRLGVTPTLRGRFVSAAARIAHEEPGFVKFGVQYAITSSQLVEQLRLHQLNCAIVNIDAIVEERNSFTVAELFEDPVTWVVPNTVSLADIKRALKKTNRPASLPEALGTFVEIDANVSLRPHTESWYRHNLPSAEPTFSATTYASAVDIVAEGLATTHCPLSLVPNLSASVREKLQFFTLPINRTIVAVMPRHLGTLPAYNNIFKRLVAFSRSEYTREMSFPGLSELPA